MFIPSTARGTWLLFPTLCVLACGAGQNTATTTSRSPPERTAQAAPTAPSAELSQLNQQPKLAAALPRFVSVNIPNLHYIEDDFRFDATQRYRLPTEFEIRDALAAVQQLGGRVVRIYALSVRKQGDDAVVPRHVQGPGVFDERCFAALDLVLALCREYGIQLIIPFVDNWRWWGGVSDYAAFRGKSPNAFWSDPQLQEDFEATVRFVTQRKNTLTGLRYADDPTILAWETGNELQSPWPWVERIAKRIKELDPNHPLIDGLHGGQIRAEALASSLIDILSTHHYTDAQAMQREIRVNLEQIAGRKPYFVGEFGFLHAPEVTQVLDTVIDGGGLGALIWSLRFRSRDGGFYWHGESEGVQSYHWPGFPAGDGYDETNVLQVLQSKAHEIANIPLPRRPTPRPPVLLPSSPNALHWQGSAGAESYRVERALAEQGLPGAWQELARGISDSAVGYRPLFTDTALEPGQPYFYRVIAENASGTSAASEPMGPVTAETLRFVDELLDATLLSPSSSGVQRLERAPMNSRMDRGRVTGAGARLVYEVNGVPRAIRVTCFLEPRALPPKLARAKGTRFVELDTTLTEAPRGTDAGTALRAVTLDARIPSPVQATALRIELTPGSSVGRVEIDYLPRP